MNFILIWYILPALVFFVGLEIVSDPEISGKNNVIVSLIPILNIFLAVLTVLLVWCKFMIWVKKDD